jgi:hypothetical protein
VSIPVELLRSDHRLTVSQAAVMRGHAAVVGQLVAAEARIAHLAPLVKNPGHSRRRRSYSTRATPNTPSTVARASLFAAAGAT